MEPLQAWATTLPAFAVTSRCALAEGIGRNQGPGEGLGRLSVPGDASRLEVLDLIISQASFPSNQDSDRTCLFTSLRQLPNSNIRDGGSGTYARHTKINPQQFPKLY